MTLTSGQVHSILKIDTLELTLNEQTSCRNVAKQLKMKPGKRVGSDALALPVLQLATRSACTALQMLSMLQHDHSIWICHSVS